MTDFRENPMGLDGIEFVEFAAPEKGILESVFATMGFAKVAVHRSKAVELWRQADINFITNYEPGSHAHYYAREHGPSACGMAFRVKNANAAYTRALECGAQPVIIETGPMELRLPAIKGIGFATVYLIDRYAEGQSIYDIDFDWIEGAEKHPTGFGLHALDHLTYNVYRGRMDYWASFYGELFNFRETGEKGSRGSDPGHLSSSLAAPDGVMCITLNEETTGGRIEEFLMQYSGEGIQHIAITCNDILASWDRLKAAGLKFTAPPPKSYYDLLEERMPGHGEPVAELRQRGIQLLESSDGGEPRLSLQMFSEPLLGPVCFKFIQRKDAEAFAQGDFRAVFESIERDRIARGAVGEIQPSAKE